MRTSPEEQLSALLDDELAGDESQLLLRRVDRDGGLKATALRYCLIGDALRGELPPARPADLVARVRTGLGAEAAPGRPGRPGRAWGRYAAGFGVAAAVAMLAIVSLPGNDPSAPEVPLSSTEVAAPAPGPVYPAAPAIARTAAGGPDRLTRYYINHSEYSPLMGGRSALSRIVVRDPRPAEEQGEFRARPVDATQ